MSGGDPRVTILYSRLWGPDPAASKLAFLLDFLFAAQILLALMSVLQSEVFGHSFSDVDASPLDGRASIRHRRAIRLGILIIVASALVSGAVYAAPVDLALTANNIDWTSAGVGGVGAGSGSIALTGVTGSVTQAFLYWHGININNPAVLIQGNSATGVSIGDSSTNSWGAGYSRAYRADVTSFVTGNGTYSISLPSTGGSPNGISLIVIFDDGNDGNNRNLYLLHGNDSSVGEATGDGPGWSTSLVLPYFGGTVLAQLHVADGQVFADGSLLFSTGMGPGVQVLDRPGLYDGVSVPDAGTSRAANGSLWDIHTFDITGAFDNGPPGAYTLSMTGQMTGQSDSVDSLGLIVLLVDTPVETVTEPETLALWLTAMAGLGLLFWRRSAAG